MSLDLSLPTWTIQYNCQCIIVKILLNTQDKSTFVKNELELSTI